MMSATATRVNRAWATIAVAPPQAHLAGCNGCGLPAPLDVLTVNLGYCDSCAQHVIDPDVWVSDQEVVDKAAAVLQPHPYVVAHRLAFDGLQPTLGQAPLANLPVGTGACRVCEERKSLTDMSDGTCGACLLMEAHYDGKHDDPATGEPSPKTMVPGCDDCVKWGHAMGWYSNGTDADVATAARKARQAQREADLKAQQVRDQAMAAAVAKRQAQVEVDKAQQRQAQHFTDVTMYLAGVGKLKNASPQSIIERVEGVLRQAQVATWPPGPMKNTVLDRANALLQQAREQQLCATNDARAAKGETVLYSHRELPGGLHIWNVWRSAGERAIACPHGTVLHCYSPQEATALLAMPGAWCTGCA